MSYRFVVLSFRASAQRQQTEAEKDWSQQSQCDVGDRPDRSQLDSIAGVAEQCDTVAGGEFEVVPDVRRFARFRGWIGDQSGVPGASATVGTFGGGSTIISAITSIDLAIAAGSEGGAIPTVEKMTPAPAITM